MLAFSAVLGLLVGAVVTTQTFYSIVTASWRELAVLPPFGISRRHIIGMIIAQGLTTAVGGLVVAIPLTMAISKAGQAFNVQAKTPPELLAGVAGIVAVVALLAAMLALRSLRLVEPAGSYAKTGEGDTHVSLAGR